MALEVAEAVPGEMVECMEKQQSALYWRFEGGAEDGTDGASEKIGCSSVKCDTGVFRSDIHICH